MAWNSDTLCHDELIVIAQLKRELEMAKSECWRLKRELSEAEEKIDQLIDDMLNEDADQDTDNA